MYEPLADKRCCGLAVNVRTSISKKLPADQRAPILKAYLQAAPGARPHVSVDKDAPLAEFEKIADAFPVFRLTSNQMKQP